jgi:hypothetical protein
LFTHVHLRPANHDEHGIPEIRQHANDRAEHKGPSTMSDRCSMIIVACALVTLTGLFVASAAGYLARRDHASYPTAVTRAAVAFAATLTLATALATAITSIARG